MKFGSWSWRQAAAPEEIKRREREFNFRAKETLSLLFSIIREIRSRSRGCEIDWSSVGRSVKSVTLWLPFRLPRITLSREIKVEFESGDAGNSIKTRSRSRSYPLVAGIKIEIHISPVVSILWKRIPICRRKYRSGVARLEEIGKKGRDKRGDDFENWSDERWNFEVIFFIRPDSVYARSAYLSWWKGEILFYRVLSAKICRANSI